MPRATRRDFLRNASQSALTLGLAMSLPNAASAETAPNAPPHDPGPAPNSMPPATARPPARFSQEYLSNPVFSEQPLSFTPVPPQRLEVVMDPATKVKNERMGLGASGKEMLTGVFPQPNGDVLFKIYAPGTQKVEVHLLAMEPRPNLLLTRQADGLHTGIFPFDPTFCGPMSTDVIFDGTVLIYPYMPVFWHRDRPVNFFEIPDPNGDFILDKDVPHGAFTREIFKTKSFGHQRLWVYTPPEYHKGGDFPTLYLQAGGGENDSTWEYNGRVAHIVDNLLAEGKCKPFVLVTCDGGAKYPEKGVGRSEAIPGFRDMMIGDVIPFIESKYRVKKDKWSRAMAGLSRGSHQTSSIGFSHPELFAYLGMFSGYMSLPTEAGGSPAETAILRDPKRFAAEYKLVFRSMGEKDHLMPHFVEDSNQMAANGLDKLPNYHCKFYPNQQHVWGAFRLGLFDFAQMIFQ